MRRLPALLLCVTLATSGCTVLLGAAAAGVSYQTTDGESVAPGLALGLLLGMIFDYRTWIKPMKEFMSSPN